MNSPPDLRSLGFLLGILWNILGVPLEVTAQSLERIGISRDGRSLVQTGSDRPFRIWGVNYDHDAAGRLLDEYWVEEWERVEQDFGEIRELGANCVRVHLQVGKFLEAPRRPNRQALRQLEKLIDLAERHQLYLNITGLACYHRANIPDWYDSLTEAERWDCQAFFWQTIARVCRQRPAVFCFDLMNEPILPGKKVETEWLTGELGGKYFVQRIALDLQQRSRKEVAESWVRQLVSAIRQEDPKTLITVGVIPWTLVWPQSQPLFYSPEVSSHLDFVSVHFYPRRGEIPQALEALKAYEIGKPLVIEETFPLKCSQDELTRFLRLSREKADGWFSFYWGATAKELRSQPQPSLADSLTANWLDQFQRLAPDFTEISQEPNKIP